jgi:hypothetical protein
MSWLTRLAVLGAIVASVGGALLLRPDIRQPGVVAVHNVVLPDRLQIAEAGALRKEHGGDSGDRIKHLIVPHADGSVAEVFYDTNRNTVTTSRETYSADGTAQVKSKARFNPAGTAAVEGTVWRPDGSIWMDYQRLANGNALRQRYTPQPDSRLFVTEVIHEVGGKPLRPKPPAAHAASRPQDKTKLQNYGWFSGYVPAPAPAPKDPSTVRRMDSTFFRPSGKKWAHLEFQWNSGWWTSGTPPRYIEGSWRMYHPLMEFFREEDETMEFKLVYEGDRCWATYCRSDGSIDYVQLWLQKYNSETGISYRLAGVDEYDLAGKIRRTLVFDEDGQAVSLLAVQTPQAPGTKVVRLTKAVSGCEGRLIESFGKGSIYRNNNWVDDEKQRRLYIGPVDKVVQPDGQVAAEECMIGDVDPAKLKFPETYPDLVEFARVRTEFERENQEFLGQRDDSNPCRWYLKGEPEPEGEDDF